MTLKLLCLLEGSHAHNLFVATVSADDYVYNLQNTIKKVNENTLRDVDAHHLKLWKVNINCSSCRNIKIEDDQEAARLWPVKILSEVFPDPPAPNHLSIIVQIDVGILRAPRQPDQPEFPAFPESPPVLIATVKASIDKFLRNLRPKIEVFLANPHLPLWEPPETLDESSHEFYREVAIPTIKNNMPNLLLHDLVKGSNPQVDNLFNSGGHRILCNTSGTGKTRLIFEGLCKHWGFYFVSARDTNGIGAQDLEFMIKRMSTTQGWVTDIFRGAAGDIADADAGNERIAHNRIYEVLLARWMVFCTFIEVAKTQNGGHLPDNIKHDWLLFQILPLVVVDGNHPFIAFMNSCLVGASLQMLLELLDATGPAAVLGSTLGNDSFFYILDEAQVAGEQYMGAFADASATVRRPVLQSIVRAWNDVSTQESIKFIISGTGFSLDLFQTVLASGAGKALDQQWAVVRDTGDFKNQGTQLSYISRYLPPSFLHSESSVVLINRMFKWLRGRHRFTARYLEELIGGKWTAAWPSSPHKVLDAYIQAYTQYAPIDGKVSLLAAEPDVKLCNIQGFTWEKIARVEGLLKELSNSIYTSITRGEYPMWYAERQNLVEFGLARFMGGGPDVTIEEPLALMSILCYFEREGCTPDASDFLRDRRFDFFSSVILNPFKLDCNN